MDRGTFLEDEPPNSVQARMPRGYVENYLAENLDTSLHPAYPGVRILAQGLSQRPEAASYQTLPILPTTIQIVDDVGEDKDKARDISLEAMYKDVEAESRRFQSAMEEFVKTLGTSKGKSPHLKHTATTWDEVLENVDKIASDYNDPSGFWGKVRMKFRKLGDNTSSMSAWLSLLPSQSQYASIVCGGLNLMLGAATRFHNLREDVAKALTEIPTLLFCTNRTLDIFSDSHELHKCSAEIFVATIALLDHILAYFKTKLSKKLLHGILKQDDYENKLTDKLETLRACLKQFEELAVTCSFATQVDTNRQVKVLQQQTDLQWNVSRMDAFAQYRVLGNRFESLTSELQQIKENMLQLPELLASNDRLHPVTHQLRGPILPLRRAISAPALARMRNSMLQSYLDMLSYQKPVTHTDIQKNLRSIWTMTSAAQDRVISIVKDRRFQAWVTELSSSVMFLNGNDSSYSKQSPTSYVCAKFITSMETTEKPQHSALQNTLAISFFCAEHLDSEDPHSNAIGMMRSLVAQLLLAYSDFDHQTIEALRVIDVDDIEGLCDIFEFLLKQLPQQIVLYCIIDAITVHEDSAVRREGVGVVIHRLVELAESKDPDQCIFKLFISSPRSSRVYHRIVSARANVITMPTTIESQGGYTEARWKSLVGTRGKS